MVRITISLRQYIYDKVFPEGEEYNNKSARIEELISKGLENENTQREEE